MASMHANIIFFKILNCLSKLLRCNAAVIETIECIRSLFKSKEKYLER